MPRSDFRFAHRLRVRWAEADMQGIVFNGHYLTYADVGITEYLRAIGFPAPWQAAPGVELFAVRTAIDYHAPARFDDLIDVCVRVVRLGRSSMQFAVEIHRAEPVPDAHLDTLEVIYCAADAVSRRAVPVPERLRARITAHEGWEPTR